MTVTRKGRSFIAVLFSGLIGVCCGCSGVQVEDFSQPTPVLDVQQFFNGKLAAHGIVKNRSGKVLRHFNAYIHAWWDENGVGHLDEHFVFDDGETQRRVWRLEPDDQGYRATANDTVGVGRATNDGNALFLRYVLSIDYKGKPLNLTVDDRMYLVNEKTLINESTLLKFGLRVGSVTLVINKLGDEL